MEDLIEGWRNAERMKADGTVNEIGIGLNDAWMALRLLDVLPSRPDEILVAGQHNLLSNDALRSGVIAACQRNGITFLAAAPFASGSILGLPVPGPGGKLFQLQNYAPQTADGARRVAALHDLCREYASTNDLQFIDVVKAAALQWFVAPKLTYDTFDVVHSPATAEQLSETLELLDLELDAQLFRDLKRAEVIEPSAAFTHAYGSPRFELAM